MSNHYHLLATVGGESIDKVMCALLKGISDDINRRAGRINQVFGGPYKWSIIEHWFGYHHALRYVYQNRCGLIYAKRSLPTVLLSETQKKVRWIYRWFLTPSRKQSIATFSKQGTSIGWIG